MLRRERGRDDDVSFDEEHDQPGDANGYGDALADTPEQAANLRVRAERPGGEDFDLVPGAA